MSCSLLFMYLFLPNTCLRGSQIVHQTQPHLSAERQQQAVRD